MTGSRLAVDHMNGSIAVCSWGLRRLAEEIHTLCGLTPEFRLLSVSGCAAVAGWGHKPTAARARAMARRSCLPYIAFEDGFLRSLKPGPAQRPQSMVMDRTGIYYDARQPSDLESILQNVSFADDEISRAREVMAAIRLHGLSKYNHGSARLDRGALPPSSSPMVLVVDQTAGDESIPGGLASPVDFQRMLTAAADENPGATLVAKLHPETLSGNRPGHIAEAASRLGFILLDSHVSPWALFDHLPHVYTVSSQFGFEALLAGCKVTCFGMPFYAGWGLTDDRRELPRRSARRNREELAAAVFLRYNHYFDAWNRLPVDALTAIDQLAFLRRSYLQNTSPVICVAVGRWKRQAIAAMLDGPGGQPRFVRSPRRALAMARRYKATIAAWGTTAVHLRPEIERHGLTCMAIEDGFIRSAGLGAAFVKPLSLVFDRQGLYFDPSRPSDIETLLREQDVPADEIARAAGLRRRIVESRITKYNVTAADPRIPTPPPGCEVILVPGQVADDAAITLGRVPGFPCGGNVNAQLLAAVRRRNPKAFVMFKPHPDVEVMGRRGRLGHHEAMAHADCIARKLPLDVLFPICHRVEVFSSLAGFEALLRGLPVTTHGIPFYAGWGLTTDHAPISRRGRRRSLDELVALALLRYPRYWDPVSGLVCPPEIAIDRIGEQRYRRHGALDWASRSLGRIVIALRRFRNTVGKAG